MRFLAGNASSNTHLERGTRRLDDTLRLIDCVPALRGDVGGGEITDETSLASALARRTTVMSRQTTSTPPRFARRVALAATGALLLLSGASAQEDGIDIAATDIAIPSMNHAQGGLSDAAEELPRFNTAGAEMDTARQEAAFGGVRSNLGAHPDFQEFITKHKGAGHTYCPNLGPDEPCLEAMRRYARATPRDPAHGTSSDETPSTDFFLKPGGSFRRSRRSCLLSEKPLKTRPDPFSPNTEQRAVFHREPSHHRGAQRAA